MNLEVELKNLKLKNPVILASGTFDKTITNHIDVSKLGGLVTKTITLKPRPGNPLPHIIKTKYGWLNSVGLKNPGIKAYLKEELPFWQKYQTAVIPSIGGENINEYIQLAKIFEHENVPAIEINISCPNVEKGLLFNTDEKLTFKLVKAVRKHFQKHLIVKLSPNVADIVSVAQAAINGGADSLSLCNTFLGLAIDNRKRRTLLQRKIGGYSGPALKPMALRIVWEVYNKLHCSIIGGGGISNFEDALDFMMVGATAVSIGSANYLDPQISIKIVKGFEKYVIESKLKNINQIKGII